MYRSDRASRNLGLEILDVAPGSVRICMTVRPEMVNGHGLCHGGIIFLAPTPAGERLTALATEASRGARHGVYDVCITNSSGETVALFRGRCARLRLPSPNGITT